MRFLKQMLWSLPCSIMHNRGNRSYGITLGVISLVGIFQFAYFGVFFQYQQYLLQQELYYQEIGLLNETWQDINNKIDFYHSFASMSVNGTSAAVSENVGSPIQRCKFPPEVLYFRQAPDIKMYNMPQLEQRFSGSQNGGRFKPEHCLPVARIAIIVPFRDRDRHLKLFLNNIIPILQRQQLDFTIYLIEQAPGIRFNRGSMRNIGFIEASKIANYDCYIFNDVDTVPEDDRNFYLCDSLSVRHLITRLKRDGYRMPYFELAGGIIAFTKDQFEAVNGYSNQFFVWGGEDDDIFRRVQKKGIKYRRPPSLIGTVTTFMHFHDPVLYDRFETLDFVKDREEEDGLSSLQYEKVFHENRKLFTWIYVQLKKSSLSGKDSTGS